MALYITFDKARKEYRYQRPVNGYRRLLPRRMFREWLGTDKKKEVLDLVPFGSAWWIVVDMERLGKYPFACHDFASSIVGTALRRQQVKCEPGPA